MTMPMIDYQALVLRGYENGRLMRRQIETDRAMAGLERGDPDAMGRLARFNPALAAQVEDQQYRRDERARASEARSALADYATARPAGPMPSALAGMGPAAQPAQPGPAVNALLGAQREVGGAPPVESAGAPFSPQASGRPVDLLPRAEPGGDDPRAAAFARLAAADPETAMKVRSLDEQQRQNVVEMLGKQMEIGGRVFSAVMEAPPAQQPDVYRRLRIELESSGVIDLPDEWDAGMAASRIRMGMTVLQAMGADRQDERLSAYLDDVEADNARADRNTDSLIADRTARRGLTARGQALTDNRMRRGQDMASRDRVRGQDMADKRARERGGPRGSAVVDVKSPAEAKALQPGTRFRTPDGRVMVR